MRMRGDGRPRAGSGACYGPQRHSDTALLWVSVDPRADHPSQGTRPTGVARVSRSGPAAVALLVLLCATGVQAQAPAGRGGPPAAPTPRTQAPIDLTGQWVAIISEDWRWRMVTPSKGDYASIPMTPAAQKVADAWDPAKDEAAGEQCRAYGAPGLMRGPTRLRISWLDDMTLKLESDYGMQTRLLHFRTPTPTQGAKTWQGVTAAQWQFAGGGRGRGPRFGSLRTVTTQLRPGYLRKNGVPYSASTVFTEHWDVHTETNGDRYLVVTNVVTDPLYLQAPFMTALHFKLEKDGAAKWNPEPCDARF